MSDQAFEYHPEAIQEAWDSYLWYEERSEVAAENFWQELRRARRSMMKHPHSWTPYLHGNRCLKLERYPYALVYIERPDRIVDIAAAHLKRRPGYWRKRLLDNSG